MVDLDAILDSMPKESDDDGNRDVVVPCSYKDEPDLYCDLMYTLEKAGYRWLSGDLPTAPTFTRCRWVVIDDQGFLTYSTQDRAPYRPQGRHILRSLPVLDDDISIDSSSFSSALNAFLS